MQAPLPCSRGTQYALNYKCGILYIFRLLYIFSEGGSDGWSCWLITYIWLAGWLPCLIHREGGLVSGEGTEVDIGRDMAAAMADPLW
jgi:hypothetical protein